MSATQLTMFSLMTEMRMLTYKKFMLSLQRKKQTDGTALCPLQKMQRGMLDGKSDDNIVRHIFPVQKYVLERIKNHQTGATNMQHTT